VRLIVICLALLSLSVVAQAQTGAPAAIETPVPEKRVAPPTESSPPAPAPKQAPASRSTGSSATAAASQTQSGLRSLQRFFTEVNRYTAFFTQVVLEDGRKPIQESKGRFWIERPNKFRWNYESPKQQIVSDGERLWIYDEELKQVTVRSLKQGLLDTPAMLLAGRGRIEDQFTVKDLGPENNIAWVQLLPKRKDSGVDEVRLGFESGRLKVFELFDGLGQTTRYTLHSGLENQPIDPSRFTFTPPPGTDVVGEQ
jgi:outer membrane lipoprotein carrier protein